MVCSVTLPSKGSLHTETRQPISIANRMTGLNTLCRVMKKFSEETMISVA